MRPSQEFRFWARRAPTGERVAAGVTTALVLGLMVLLLVWLVPGGAGRATNLASGNGGSGSAAGQNPDAGGTTGAAGAQGAGSAAAGSATGAGSGGAGGAAARGAAGAGAGGGIAVVKPGCPPLGAGTKGVTATQIKI